MDSFDLSYMLEKKTFLISVNTAIISLRLKIACCLVCSFIVFSEYHFMSFSNKDIITFFQLLPSDFKSSGKVKQISAHFS